MGYFKRRKEEKKKGERMTMAVLGVLYEAWPLGLEQDEIGKRIEEKGLLEMSDEEFEKYRLETIRQKKN